MLVTYNNSSIRLPLDSLHPLTQINQETLSELLQVNPLKIMSTPKYFMLKDVQINDINIPQFYFEVVSNDTPSQLGLDVVVLGLDKRYLDYNGYISIWKSNILGDKQ